MPVPSPFSSGSVAAPPTRVLIQNGRPVARRVERFRLAVSDDAPTAADRGKVIEGALRPVRIGSLEGNELRLQDQTVSRYHVEIEATPDGYALRDLGSTNGTTVDGLRVRDVYLPDRCLIRVGAVALRFELCGTADEIALSSDDRFAGALGRSPAMRELFAILEKVAAKDLTVLIEGESGTGKELIAEAIAAQSKRSDEPFVVFDCAAIASSLVESELFGHEKGAFTGAVGRRVGRFEEAHGGTLFLDEIGELPLDLQPKLLRALERREVRRVGAAGTTAVDVRIVAATNRDLSREVNRGTFREDLYYRLAVVRLTVPPLRERKEDIPLLVEHFVRRAFGEETGQAAKADETLRVITPEVWRRLHDHPWPGNVRELRNFIDRSLAITDQIHGPAGAEPVSAGAVAAPLEVSADGMPPLDLTRPFVACRDELMSAFERQYLRAALDEAKGNLSAAARRAGLDRMYFKRLCRRHGLTHDHDRE